MPTSTERSAAEPLALAQLRDRVVELETEAQELRVEATELRTETAAFRLITVIAGIAIVLVLALCVTGGVYLYLGRASARASYNTQLRNLACLALHYTPPGTSFHADLRALYPNCPPYRTPAGSAPASARSSSTSPAPRPTSITPQAVAPSRAAQNAPTAAAHPSRVVARPTAVRRRGAGTPAAPRRGAPSPHPSATSTAPGLLGGVVHAVCTTAPLPIVCP